MLDKHCPVKIFSNRKHYVPYLTPEIKGLMDERDRHKKHSVNTGDPYSYDQYKIYRNQVTNKLKSAEKVYYKKKFSETQPRDVGGMWQTIYEAIGSVRSSPPSQLFINGQMFCRPIEMAREMNKFFLNKVEILQNGLSGNVQIEPEKRLGMWLNGKPIPGLQLKPVLENDVKVAFGKLSGSKSTGIDDIDGFSIKIASPHILKAVTHITNLSIS